MLVYLQLQQPRPESYTKESYANSSLGRRRIIAMVQKNFIFRPYLNFLLFCITHDLWLQKANNENSSETDEGCDVPSFLHKQPTNKVHANNLSKTMWFCCFI
jgi:hypothetical protein